MSDAIRDVEAVSELILSTWCEAPDERSCESSDTCLLDAARMSDPALMSETI